MSRVLSAPIRVPIGDQFELNQMGERHLDEVRTAFADEFTSLWNPVTVDDRGETLSIRQWLRERSRRTDPTRLAWGVFARDADELLGYVTLHRINLPQATAHIGYWTHPDHRRRGLATLAVGGAVRVGMDDLGLQRITLSHAVANTASCAVADRNGFKLEGTMRQSTVYGDGRRHDEHLHGLIAADRAELEDGRSSTA